MALSNENNPRICLAQIGDVVAASAETRPGIMPIGKDVIKSVKLLNGAALAGDDTNNVEVSLKRKSDDAVIASFLNDVAGGGLLANRGKDMPLVSEALAELADGDDVYVQIAHNGTGQALTNAVVQIELVA